jgi:hypothetical protein
MTTYDTRGGLPYEECRRWQRREQARPGDRSRDRTPPLYLASIPPPLIPGPDPTLTPAAGPAPAPAPRPWWRRRALRADPAVVSGVLVVLCVASLVVAIVATAVRPRG